MVVLVTPTAVKVRGAIPWIHHTRVKKAALPVMRTPGKQLWTPETPSRSGSKNNGPHPQKTLHPALVALKAD